VPARKLPIFRNHDEKIQKIGLVSFQKSLFRENYYIFGQKI